MVWQLPPVLLLLIICFLAQLLSSPWASCARLSLCTLLLQHDLCITFQLPGAQPLSSLPEFIYTVWGFSSETLSLKFLARPSIHSLDVLSFIVLAIVKILCAFVWSLTNTCLPALLKFHEDRDYVFYCLSLYSQKSA